VSLEVYHLEVMTHFCTGPLQKDDITCQIVSHAHVH
jgi:hypothetical protein